MNKIGIPTALIVSAGRTGTKFFGDRLARLIPDCHSVHEPDVLAGLEYPVWPRLRDFGFYHMVVGRVLGRTGIRNLSLRYLSGKMTADEAIEAVIRHRAVYYASLGAPMVVEAYTGWFGLLPVLPAAFDRLRVVVIYRDPREWVRSIMNWGTLYGPRDWVGMLGLGRLVPDTIGDRTTAARWKTMSRFEKVCWAWTAINRTLADGASNLQDCLICRYEDLFEEQNEELQRRLLAFVTDFGELRFSYDFNAREFGERVHGSNPGFPSWQQWNDEYVAALQRHCGEVMGQLGYGNEPQWRERLSQSGISG